MKTLLLALLLLAGRADTLNVMFWNLENFFDYRNDSTSVSDADFSPRGSRHWTKKRFYAKCNAVAKGILWASAREGAVPDVIGLAEIENAFVLRRLIQATVLRKLDYKIVHFDSPDRRGIDVALLYRGLKPLESHPAHLFNADSTIMATRDILISTFTTQQGDTVAFLVNHHPSKFGGATASEARRNIAVERLRQLADSLQTLGIENIIAMGDFNDTPGNPVYHVVEPTLWNKAEQFHKKGRGTIKFNGKWELIDMFFVSEPIKNAEMEILDIPFLQTQDKASTGTKPLRTYSGPRYLGGVSDHCPIWLQLIR
ncbi:MAG: hypothetical protein IJR12_01585 [Bacteroidales bacterium]|nr:hypothetical protein [Bacteroidales bacterium]